MPNDPDPESPDPGAAESGEPQHVSGEPSEASKKPAKVPPAAAVDEDDDEEVDEEDEPPPPPPPRRGKGAKSKRGARPAPPPPPTDEREIDAPSYQTFGMLAAVSLATLVMWGAGRAACNYHPPETRKARAMPVAELAKEPKDAAVEMQQRLSTYDFASALQLSKGKVEDEVRRAQQACEANRADCDKKRGDFSDDKVFTAGELLSRDGTTASVRVTVNGAEGGKKSYLFGLEKDGAIWKAVSRGDAAADMPRRAPVPMPVPTAETTASASAAPAPSASAHAVKPRPSGAGKAPTTSAP